MPSPCYGSPGFVKLVQEAQAEAPQSEEAKRQEGESLAYVRLPH